jgi:hypothetical protein
VNQFYRREPRTNIWPDIGLRLARGGGSRQNISHLFGPGTTVLIGPAWFLVSFWTGSAGPIGGILERNPKPIELDVYLKYPTTANVFLEEVAISTTSAIHQ